MNQRDLSEILVMSAGLSKTTIGDTDVLAWFELPEIRKLDAAKAKEAVRIYYQQNDKPMKPVHLIQYAKTVGGNTTHYGEPGEILCPECRGVHYPHEDCSVLITLQQYGVQRFWDEVDKRRAELGYGPLDTRRRRRLAAGLPIPVPTERENRETRRAAPAQVRGRRPSNTTRQNVVTINDLPPRDAPTAACSSCHTTYLDYPGGIEAHRVVFGHAPRKAPDPTTITDAEDLSGF